MKTFLIIIAIVAVVATFTEAQTYDKSLPVSCDNWKNMTGRCVGCVFTAGDMKGKCKRTGQYFDEETCENEGGTWCTA